MIAPIIRPKQGASCAPMPRTRTHRAAHLLLMTALGLVLTATSGCQDTSASQGARQPGSAPSTATGSGGQGGGVATNGRGGDAEPTSKNKACNLLRGAKLGIHGIMPAGDPNHPDETSQGCNLSTDQGFITVTRFHGHQNPRITDTAGIVPIQGGPTQLYDYNGTGQTGFFVQPAPEAGQDYVITIFLPIPNPDLLKKLLAFAYGRLSTNPA
jgi:hypothetical protein